ncbi:MAG: hypothetical protein ACO1OT_02315 [Heyndrickxia sp.]
MNHEMDHTIMNSSNISWVFVVISLVIIFLLVFHIVYTLWEHEKLLRQLLDQHSSLTHSIPMSLGMSSTMSLCIFLGGIMINHQSVSYIVGLIVGVFISGIISSPFKDGIAMLDGIISGSMGGLMGVMAGVMIPQIGLYIVSTLLIILFAITWIVIYRRINNAIT